MKQSLGEQRVLFVCRKGANRQVTVFKHHLNEDAKSTYEVPFTAESHRLVQEYLERSDIPALIKHFMYCSVCAMEV